MLDTAQATLKQLVPVLLLFSAAACSEKGSHAPEQGTVEREAIIEALRVPGERDLKRPADIRIDRLKVQNQWAFLGGVPRSPDGKPMQYDGTRYQEQVRLGMFDDSIYALIHKPAGKWIVVEYSIGATDVPYMGWGGKHAAPSAIFE